MNTWRNFEAFCMPAPKGRVVLSFWLQPSQLASGAQRESLGNSPGVSESLVSAWGIPWGIGLSIMHHKLYSSCLAKSQGPDNTTPLASCFK